MRNLKQKTASDTMKMNAYAACLEERIRQADTPDAKQTIDRAKDLMKKIESGQRNEEWLFTVEEHVRNAEKINRIMGE